jgi:SH3-like domain-containing protein
MLLVSNLMEQKPCAILFPVVMLHTEFLELFEVLKAVDMKASIIWEITQHTLTKVNRCFGGACRLQLQGQAKKETNMKQVASRAAFLHD